MASIGAIFTSTYHTKQLNRLVKLISQSCGELQPAVCLSRGYTAIWRRPEHSWTSDKPHWETSHSKSSLGNIQHQYLPELLINWCIQLLFDGESVSCCCVRGRHLLSNPVTSRVRYCKSWYKNGKNSWSYQGKILRDHFLEWLVIHAGVTLGRFLHQLVVVFYIPTSIESIIYIWEGFTLVGVLA